MHIYRGWLQLQDYLFFASTERGKVYETGAFVHNYALAYAMYLATSTYYHREQKPNYVDELAPLNAHGIYLTPAAPKYTLYRMMQWNTIAETYGFGKKPQSLGYPDWGFARVLCPESTFCFFVLVARLEKVEAPTLTQALRGNPIYIRLGKFPAKARVWLEPAIKVEEKHAEFIVQSKDEHTFSAVYLNWRDCLIDPWVCDLVPATLPTRLISNAHFREGDHYLATFNDHSQVTLPAGMHFLARTAQFSKGYGC